MSEGKETSTKFERRSGSIPDAAEVPAPEFKSNRADLILVLGIFSLFCCPPLGVLAWIMGSSDLKRIRQGTMSPEHMGTLRVGWVLGMVGTFLFVLWLLVVGWLAHSVPGSFRDLQGFLGHRLEGLKKDVEEDLKASPLTPDQMVYSGEWAGNRGTRMKIYPNGTADCKSRRDNYSSEQVGGRVKIENDKLSLGFFGLYSTWHIDRAPFRENGTWTMILDGEVFLRKGHIEEPRPDEKRPGQRPREYEV
jgi:hypothetical protein